MKLTELGEDALIQRLLRGLGSSAEVRVGPGDDCAVIGRPRDARWTLLKTDCVIEGIHFNRDEKRRRVGWKALCRAVSDIAAMSGLPRHALVTLAVSRTAEVTEIDELYRGLARAARRFDITIVGGETARSPGPLFLSIALTGEVERGRCVLRSGGKPGDALYVTGHLGGSRAGKHLDFIPRVAEARWLTEHFRLRAMMDLSDGLGSDLPRLARASRCGYELDPTLIPCNSGCTVEQAMRDGEDFELLFALPARMGNDLEAAWHRKFPNLKLTRIGRLAVPSKTKPTPKTSGFDHFTQA